MKYNKVFKQYTAPPIGRDGHCTCQQKSVQNWLLINLAILMTPLWSQPDIPMLIHVLVTITCFKVLSIRNKYLNMRKFNYENLADTWCWYQLQSEKTFHCSTYFPDVKLWKLCVPWYNFNRPFTSSIISSEKQIQLCEKCPPNDGVFLTNFHWTPILFIVDLFIKSHDIYVSWSKRDMWTCDRSLLSAAGNQS